MRPSLLIVFGLAAALAAEVAALDRPRGALSDVDGQQPLARVRELLAATQAITVFDHVTATSDGGVITLAGKVTSQAKRDQLETEVATVPGVRQVVNRIRALPASASDDALRQRVARAIYGHPSFKHYSAMSHPPIRIIVERGRVALAGSVRTAVERLVARSLAEEAAGSRVDDELRINGA